MYRINIVFNFRLCIYSVIYVISINVTREGYISPLEVSEQVHITELALNDYKNFDYTIINKTNFINDFFTHIKTMIEEIENDSRE